MTTNVKEKTRTAEVTSSNSIDEASIITKTANITADTRMIRIVISSVFLRTNLHDTSTIITIWVMEDDYSVVEGMITIIPSRKKSYHSQGYS